MPMVKTTGRMGHARAPLLLSSKDCEDNVETHVGSKTKMRRFTMLAAKKKRIETKKSNSPLEELNMKGSPYLLPGDEFADQPVPRLSAALASCTDDESLNTAKKKDESKSAVEFSDCSSLTDRSSSSENTYERERLQHTERTIAGARLIKEMINKSNPASIAGDKHEANGEAELTNEEVALDSAASASIPQTGQQDFPENKHTVFKHQEETVALDEFVEDSNTDFVNFSEAEKQVSDSLPDTTATSASTAPEFSNDNGSDWVTFDETPDSSFFKSKDESALPARSTRSAGDESKSSRLESIEQVDSDLYKEGGAYVNMDPDIAILHEEDSFGNESEGADGDYEHISPSEAKVKQIDVASVEEKCEDVKANYEEVEASDQGYCINNKESEQSDVLPVEEEREGENEDEEMEADDQGYGATHEGSEQIDVKGEVEDENKDDEIEADDQGYDATNEESEVESTVQESVKTFTDLVNRDRHQGNEQTVCESFSGDQADDETEKKSGGKSALSESNLVEDAGVEKQYRRKKQQRRKRRKGRPIKPSKATMCGMSNTAEELFRDMRIGVEDTVADLISPCIVMECPEEQGGDSVASTVSGDESSRDDESRVSWQDNEQEMFRC